jgi:hypothetical protein
MNSRAEQIMYYIKQLGISIDEERFLEDLDEISDAVSDTFWDDMYRDGNYETCISNAEDLLDEQLGELPYILEHREAADEDWDESEDYEAFRNLVRDEIFERGDIPGNESDAQDRLEENDGDSDDEFEDEENS